MDVEEKELYKKLTHNIFISALVLVGVRVFVDIGLIGFIVKDFIPYEDFISFILMLMICIFYIIGGLWSFKEGAKKYFYLLIIDIAFLFLYYTYYTEIFTLSFDAVNNSPYYNVFTFVHSILILIGTVGIFKENFASDAKLIRKK